MGFSKAADFDEKASIFAKDGVLEQKDGNFEVKTPSRVIDGNRKEESEVDIVSRGSLSPCSGGVSVLDSSPRTPKEDVFDPFAPGREELCFAPLVKKLAKEVKVDIARRLDFGVLEQEEKEKEKGDFGVLEKEEKEKGDLGLEDSSLREEVLLETMYESFLDAIVTNQTGSITEEIGGCEEDGLKTPTKVAFLSGIAEICPAAPKKPSRPWRKPDAALCRKLEF